MSGIGKRLRELRQNANLSQSDLSKEIGVSKSSINMYERDEREPSFETTEAIADYFNVPIDFLLQRPPFDNWDDIECDRRSFLVACDANPDILQLVWGINPSAPYLVSKKTFISFVSMAVASAQRDQSGKWYVTLHETYRNYSAKPSQPPSVSEHNDEPEIRAIQRAAKNMSQGDKQRMLAMLQLAFHEAFEDNNGDKS